MAKSLTTKDTLNLIDQYLQPVRDRIQKEAATSKMDTVTPEELQKPMQASTSQSDLGKEQTDAAHESGGTADTVAAIKDGDGDEMVDTLGPNTLKVGEGVEGQIGEPRKQILDQKIASNIKRADTLSDKILHYLSKSLDKEAAAAPAQKEAAQKEEELPEAYRELLKEAQDKAQQYYESYVFARLKRAQDEAEVRDAGITDEMCKAYGGVSGLLDKIAADDITAVLPEEAVADMGEELPVEGEEGPAMDELDALAADLESQGVTEEDLAEAMAEVEALVAQGVPPEVIQQAVAEELEAAAAQEVPVEEVPVEAEKLASDRELVDAVRQYLRK